MEKDVQSTAVPLDVHQSERKNPLTGLVEWLPSLAPVWCTDVQFLCYVPPQITSTGEVSPEWLEALDIMNNDLRWLLLQTHQKFWCQVMYDQTLQKFLDTYVQSAPRYYDEWPKLPAGVAETAKELHRRVFVTFIRMSTPKETDTQYLSDEAYSSIIYDHYLFDIPKLMDLCVLYGRANQAAVCTVLTTVFEKQSKYTEDLVNAAKGLVQVLNKAADRCHEVESGMSAVDLTDLILYASDISSTLRAFLEVYPSGGPYLEEAGLIERLVHFYESTIPALQSAWHTHKRTILGADNLKKHLRHAKRDLSWVVNCLLHLCYLNEATAGRESSSPGCDGFLHAVSTILSEKVFLQEFQKHFNLKDCIQKVQNNHPELDSTLFTYALSALGEDDIVTQTADNPTSMATLKDLIKHVKDVFPELGDDFIKACLTEYKNNAEAVINHILEGTLPSHVHQQSGAAQSHAGDDKPQATELPLVTQRANVYDGDSFDVFRRSDIDISKVNIGKRHNTSSVAAVLSDKSHLKQTRDLYKNFEYESNDPEECVDDDGIRGSYNEKYMYDDEYDDTYDSHDVGVADSVTTDEVFAVRRLNEKGLFQRRYSSSEDDDDEEVEPSGSLTDKGPPSSAARVVILKRDTTQKAQNLANSGERQVKGAKHAQMQGDYAERKERNNGRRGNMGKYGREYEDNVTEYEKKGGGFEKRETLERKDELKTDRRDERRGKERYDRQEESDVSTRGRKGYPQHREEESDVGARGRKGYPQHREEESDVSTRGRKGYPQHREEESDVGTRGRKGYPQHREQYGHGPGRLTPDMQRSSNGELKRDANSGDWYEQRKEVKEKTTKGHSSGVAHDDTSTASVSTKHDHDQRGAGKEHQSGAKPLDDERSRQSKERHKGERANHNRKKLADVKRSKGMGGLF